MKTTYREAKQNQRFTGAKSEPDAEEDNNDAQSPPGAVVFCGDTKGNIRCFLEEPRAGSRGPDGRISDAEEGRISVEGGVSGGLGEGVPPCLVLKGQHGKDQVGHSTAVRQAKFKLCADCYCGYYLARVLGLLISASDLAVLLLGATNER